MTEIESLRAHSVVALAKGKHARTKVRNMAWLRWPWSLDPRELMVNTTMLRTIFMMIGICLNKNVDASCFWFKTNAFRARDLNFSEAKAGLRCSSSSQTETSSEGPKKVFAEDVGASSVALESQQISSSLLSKLNYSMFLPLGGKLSLGITGV